MTVKMLIDGIVNDRKYFLPSIQREFVWETDRITKLFDSLMRGFPIGSFLFWKIPKEKIADFQFYEFIHDYNPLDNHDYSIALHQSDRSFEAVLDGQQRMTALYIGLMGSYTEKIKYKKLNSSDAFQTKKLYLNLLNVFDSTTDDEAELKYDLKFLSQADLLKLNESVKAHWFEVGKILNPEFKPGKTGIDKYLKEKNLTTENCSREILTALQNAIWTDWAINYYLEDREELHDVVNIFIRINSAGKQLNKSDLLLSFATAQLHELRNVRKDINDCVKKINNIGGFKNFAFDKDFVFKAFLILCDSADDKFKFKRTDFNKKKMLEIHNRWNEMTKAIELAVELIASYGFNKENIVSTNVFIPIAHYILKKGNNPKLYKDDKNIIRWFIIASLGGMFSASTDTVLGNLRGIIKADNSSFPAQKMLDKKDISVESIINEVLDTQYKDKSKDMAIFILYPHINLANNYHIDHIFPQSKFKKKTLSDNNITDTDFYMNNFNSFANLQLLTAPQNQSKNDKDFDAWLNEKPINYNTDDHCIPMDINLSFGNFKEFIQKREELIRQRLKENLKSWNIFI